MKKNRRRKVTFIATDRKIVFYAPKKQAEREDYNWEDPRRIYNLPFIPTMACGFGFIIGSFFGQIGFGFLSVIVLLLMVAWCVYCMLNDFQLK